MRAVYGESDKRIGSLKGNVGHLITAAGVAGLIKVMEALREGVTSRRPRIRTRVSTRSPRPPSRRSDRAEPWRGPRRAGLSAFGFGGNDAHLIVEAFEPERAFAPVQAALSRDPIVAVGIGARVGDGQSAADFERSLGGRGRARAADRALPDEGAPLSAR